MITHAIRLASAILIGLALPLAASNGARAADDGSASGDAGSSVNLPAAGAGSGAGGAGGGGTMADPVFSNNLRLGLYAIFYHTSAQNLQQVAGPEINIPGTQPNLHADNNQTLYAAYVRRLTEHFQVELAFGVPPLNKTEGRGPTYLGTAPYNGRVIASARWFAPSALVEYSFFGDHAPLRPYIGVGVNYTSFYDRNSTSAGDLASGGPTKLELPSSVGPVGTIGLAYKITPHWGVYGSWSWSRVNTLLTADTADVVRTSHIHFNPQALVVSGGYSF